MNIKVFIDSIQNAHVLPCTLGYTTFESNRHLALRQNLAVLKPIQVVFKNDIGSAV